MNDYQKALIKEHKELIERIHVLNDYVYSGEAEKNDCKIEFANKCIQLSAMKKYEEALRGRLYNSGIIIAENNYLEVIDTPEHKLPGSFAELGLTMFYDEGKGDDKTNCCKSSIKSCNCNDSE